MNALDATFFSPHPKRSVRQARRPRTAIANGPTDNCLGANPSGDEFCHSWHVLARICVGEVIGSAEQRFAVRLSHDCVVSAPSYGRPRERGSVEAVSARPCLVLAGVMALIESIASKCREP